MRDRRAGDRKAARFALISMISLVVIVPNGGRTAETSQDPRARSDNARASVSGFLYKIDAERSDALASLPWLSDRLAHYLPTSGFHHLKPFNAIGSVPVAAMRTFRFRRVKLPVGSRPLSDITEAKTNRTTCRYITPYPRYDSTGPSNRQMRTFIGIT